jgi:cell division protein DivIC
VSKLLRNKKKKDDRVIDIEAAREERRRQLQRLSRRRGNKSVKRKTIYCLVLIIFVSIIGMSIYNVATLKAERTLAEMKLLSLEKEKKALEEELLEIDSEEYIEQQAREKLRMILPGETLYVLKESENNRNEAQD